MLAGASPHERLDVETLYGGCWLASRRTIRTSSRISSFIITSPIFSRSVSSAGWSFSCLQFIPLLRWEGHAQILSAPCLLSRGGKHCSNSLFPSRPEGPACTECCLMFASPSGAEGELKTLARYLQFSRPSQCGQLIQSVLQPSRRLPAWRHWCFSYRQQVPQKLTAMFQGDMFVLFY